MKPCCPAQFLESHDVAATLGFEIFARLHLRDPADRALKFVGERSVTRETKYGRLPTGAVETSHKLDQGPLRPSGIEVGDAECDADRG